MPSRRQRMLYAIRTSDICPHCSQEITAAQLVRLSSDECRCPHCGNTYPANPGTWSQLHRD